jgi:hypothetical protein
MGDEDATAAAVAKDQVGDEAELVALLATTLQ